MIENKNIKIFTCSPDEKIKSILKKININLTGTIFVTYKKKILGCVTDGDIRRALIKGYNLRHNIKSIMNKNYIYLKNTYTKKKINQILKKYKYKCRIFPILNSEKNILSFIKNEKIPIYKSNLSGKESQYLQDCVNNNWISSGGNFIPKFENKFSELHLKRPSLTVTSATTGIHLSLVALGVKRDDEVIVPNLTFAAVINAVLYIGAKPILVDIDKNKWTIDCEELAKKISKKTKAVIAVHLFGNPCNMNDLIKITKKNSLLLIEDCAEAIGSQYKKKPLGIFGDCGVFSFFGNKTITTGEGGMIIFKNKKIYKIAKQMRDHGMSLTKKYYHDVIGYNYRMTNMQAAIGLAQLERFKKIIKQKILIQEFYKKILQKKKEIIFQQNEKYSINSFWAVGILIDIKQFNYKIFSKKMNKKGIETRNFFYPLNKQKIYEKYAIKKNYSTDIICKNGVMLPTYPSLKKKDIKYICNELIKNI
jgi:perosamine synthetase